jgi:hypothetical protein
MTNIGRVRYMEVHLIVGFCTQRSKLCAVVLLTFRPSEFASTPPSHLNGNTLLPPMFQTL